MYELYLTSKVNVHQLKMLIGFVPMRLKCFSLHPAKKPSVSCDSVKVVRSNFARKGSDLHVNGQDKAIEDLSFALLFAST